MDKETIANKKQFHFKIMYRLWSRKTKADALSRIHLGETEEEPNSQETILPERVHLASVRWEIDKEIEQAARDAVIPMECPAEEHYVPVSCQDRLLTWAHSSCTTAPQPVLASRMEDTTCPDPAPVPGLVEATQSVLVARDVTQPVPVSCIRVVAACNVWDIGMNYLHYHMKHGSPLRIQRLLLPYPLPFNLPILRGILAGVVAQVY
ncbi:hypothetical protein P4O66_004740 [Electrophorus voltai]|uniref:Uncharacterized protein n=1 Tax=Electrophorus voltai TaxID=2609070 RepID=A0AAD8ZKW8_9TELE|nr:hypothetical protein P4O66_004740 [Electrophorus voltai]